ncbi:hypothetical protein B0H98_105232 [Vreelandella songnenensis]|uniref:Uncharacterized protein n=1 Tax=Vreelandella songnenensis TaxID=1176243 RepID=A0A2T0V309_9GAMM|nr:hypothetical protein [Halomonas songnenensis]PRY64565.1 hypothetical protein B0H98_105232 [Halomonas songnenensis]
MSQDQAAGLRQWADAQRMKQEQGGEELAEESLAPMTPVPASQAAPESELSPEVSSGAPQPIAPLAITPPAPLKPLWVIGPAGRGTLTRAQVKQRLGQWSTLGRKWAGSPEAWEIHVIDPDAPELARLTAQHARWALWISSDADAFAQMYRALRLAREHGGPQRLLALHEPNVRRQGLLSNLRAAAASYLATDLLLLAR